MITALAPGLRLEPIDVVALVVIIWLALAIVAAPFLGTLIDRAGKIAENRVRATTRRWWRRRRRQHEDDRPVGYRPPRD